MVQGLGSITEPLDRIYELGDASVPFDFDVHGLIFSENAPELENMLHKRLEPKRMNLVNYRAEFFKTSLEEIEEIVKAIGLTVQITKIAEAKEYRETISMRESKTNETNGQSVKINTEVEKILEKFPTTLD